MAKVLYKEGIFRVFEEDTDNTIKVQRKDHWYSRIKTIKTYRYETLKQRCGFVTAAKTYMHLCNEQYEKRSV